MMPIIGATPSQNPNIRAIRAERCQSHRQPAERERGPEVVQAEGESEDEKAAEHVVGGGQYR